MKVSTEKVATRSSRRLYEKRLRTIQRLSLDQLKVTVRSKVTKMPNAEKPPIQASAGNVENSDLAGLLRELLVKKESGVSADGFEKIIPNYDGESIPIKNWIENFEKNAEAYELNEKQKYVHARNKMIGTAKLYLDAITVSDFATLKFVLFEEFRKNVDSADVHKSLQSRRKKDGETLHEYILHMTKIAAMGNVEDSALIKYIIDGLYVSNEVKIHLCTSKTTRELKEKYELVEHMIEIKQPKKNDVIRNHGQQPKKSLHCFNCGSPDHVRRECRTNTKCFKCNENGHISKNCPLSVKPINAVVKCNRTKTFEVNGIQVEGLVDTGADATILKVSIYKKLGAMPLEKCYTVLRGLGNLKTHPIGQFTGEVRIDNEQTKQRFVVVADSAMGNDALLGYDFIEKFTLTSDENGFIFSERRSGTEDVSTNEISIYNVVENNNDIVVPQSYKEVVMNMIENYSPRPEKKCPIELKIVPDGVITPFRQAPSRLPETESNAVRTKVDEWLQNGVVRMSTSFVASRVVVVKKKDDTLRICVDFRKLNSMVLKDCFPIPVIEDIFVKLTKAKYFIVMDLENGFFHVPVEENSKKYLAFVTKEGLFEFNVAPFGFCNSPAAFIRFVNHIFQDFINNSVMELYMDDIVIFAETAEICLNKAKRVLKRAEEYNLNIKWKKCSFLVTKINFLGHVIEGGKVWPGQEKTKAVKNFKTPTNVKAVQSFLGLTGFFRRFILNYASMARPLTNLLRKNVDFEMGSAELNSVQALKDALVSEPVLVLYDRNARTELHTDASKEGFGATLLQLYEGAMHPVYYFSKKTSEAESQKHSYTLEIKAAFLAMKKFRNYLLGISFTLVTDCSAFTYTLKKQDVPREVSQWVLYFQDFDFTVEHRSGNRMRHVDFFSRYPLNVMVNTTELTPQFRRAQQNDNYVKAVAEILKTRPYENYKVKGGLVYRNVEGNDVLVVPKAMEVEIIRDAHKVGHAAAQKTMHTLRQTYWIPHMEKKVNDLIANCVKCIVHNKKLGKKEGYLHCIEKGDVPLYTVHVDHLGPLDGTAKQYKYIFAVVDAFTKFTWLYPTKSTGVDEVVKKLTDWANVFGNPARLVSDRGAAFTSNNFGDFVKTRNIEHVVTTTGVARGNGQIERVNRVILAVISKLSTADTTKWYKYVAEVQVAINAQVHSSTKKSPFQLLFGVKMKTTLSDCILPTLQQELVSSFEEDRQQMREEAKKQIREAQLLYKNNYDKKRKMETVYKIGDLVAIRRTQFVAGKKLASEYIGPYEVVEVKRNGRYNVKRVTPGDGPKTTSTSCDNMKLWAYIETNNDALSSGSDEEM